MTRTLRNFILLLLSLSIIFGLASISIIDLTRVAAHQFSGNNKVLALQRIQKLQKRHKGMHGILAIQRPGLRIVPAPLPAPHSRQLGDTLDEGTLQWIAKHADVNRYSLPYAARNASNNHRWLVVEFEPNLLAQDTMQHDIWILVALSLLLIAACYWFAVDFNRPIKQLKMISKKIGQGNLLPHIINIDTPELQPIANAINEQSSRINQLMSDRTQMLAAISHDLRTPITRLRLRAESIIDSTLAQKVSDDCDEMEAMISAVLEFIRTESDEHPVNFDLISLLETLTNERQDAELPCTISSSCEQCAFEGQMAALRRAFSNLIDNGLKYGKSVAIDLDKKSDNITITISDHGPGIPESEFNRVFEPFYRLEKSRNKATGGTGLGLFIAKNIIAHHNGQIVLSNKASGGLQVSIILPVH